MKNWERTIREETEKCKVTTLGENDKHYPYAILPLESRANPKYLNAITSGLVSMLAREIKKANVIVGIEAKGFFPSVLVAKNSRKKLVVIRKRDYKTPDQVVFEHETAYGKKESLYCVGLEKGDKILIIDDIISSGDTAKAVINKLKKKHKVVGIGTLYDRSDGRKIIKKETGISPKSLATIDVIDGSVKVLNFYPDNNLSD
jgi:adenine phosphoribosyltransferase